MLKFSREEMCTDVEVQLQGDLQILHLFTKREPTYTLGTAKMEVKKVSGSGTLQTLMPDFVYLT